MDPLSDTIVATHSYLQLYCSCKGWGLAMWVTDGPSAVQFIVMVSGTLMAASHILRPDVWEEYFRRLQEQGTSGVLTRTFTFELSPALLIVTLHQVWSGLAIVVTIYGWLQLTKIAVSVLAPEIGFRSLALANRGPGAFRLGGIMLLAVSACATGALFLDL